jgi:tetratricopeptide (TPR) repeat protein
MKQKAYVYFAQGQTDAALGEIDKAIRIKPEAADLYCGRAEFCIAKGRYLAAVADADKALALDARYSIAHYRKGLALEKLGKPAEAYAAYKRFLENPPPYYPNEFSDAKKKVQAYAGKGK